MNDIRAMQIRQREWSVANFPDRRADHAVMGLIEELGELCEVLDFEDETPVEYIMICTMMIYLGRLAHIQLKRAQGIRPETTTPEQEYEAIDRLSRAFWEYHVDAGYLPNPDIAPEDHEPDLAKEHDAVGDLFIYLLDRANRRGFDLQTITEDTLDAVLQRNWRPNPDTGTGKVA